MNATRTLLAARKKELQTSLRLCTLEGLVAMPLVMMTLPTNMVLIALFTKALALPAATIGLLTSLPFVGNFLQLAITPVLTRFFPDKHVSIATAGVQAAGWAALVVMLSFIPADDHVAAGRWLAVWFFISSLFGSIAGVTWNAWTQEWVPPRLRGKYFGRRNRLLQLSTLCFLLLSGWVLSSWEYSLRAFQLVILLSLALRVQSLRWQIRMPARERGHDAGLKPTLRQQLGIVRRSRSFFTFAVFGAVWSFASNCFGPFYHVFMYEQLGLSAFDVGTFGTIAALGGALSLPVWGQLLDRHGNKAVMVVSLVLWQLQNYLWCFLTPENSGMLYGMWAVGGTVSAGFVLGLFTLQLKLIPPPAKNLAIGINLALSSVVAAIAPVIGGQVLGRASVRFPEDLLTVYHVCFAVQPTLGILGVVILLRIKEPAASPFFHVVGAMRNLRTLSGVFGLGFLTDYLFYRAPRR